MADIEKVIKGLECCTSENGQLNCEDCPYRKRNNFCDNLERDALELLKEQKKKKSKEEVLSAIISSLGYTDVETFKRTVLEIDNFEDYFLGGMLRAVQAVEKLFEA